MQKLEEELITEAYMNQDVGFLNLQKERKKRLVEDKYNTYIWQLRHLSNALTRAIRLEKQRAEFYQELYESIRCTSVAYYHDNIGVQAASTEMQAIKIINAKERYDKEVMKEYKNHFRWRDILSLVDEQDRILMIRYFQKRKPVKPEVITNILIRLRKWLEHEEEALSRERDAEALEEYQLYKKIHPERFKPKVDPNKGKHHVFIRGKGFVYMTDEELAEHHRKEEEMRKRFGFYERGEDDEQ